MGIKENLQTFLDPDYSGYIGFPETPDNPTSLGISWGNAIGPEIDLFLLPSLPAGLNASVAGSTFLSAISTDPIAFSPNPIYPGNFPISLNSALDNAVSTVVATISTAPPPIQPSPFQSTLVIFPPDWLSKWESGEITPEIFCQNVQDEILNWLQTGTFTAFYVPPGTPPAGFSGIPFIPWGTAPPEPPDLDKDDDGIKISDDPPDPDDEDSSIP